MKSTRTCKDTMDRSEARVVDVDLTKEVPPKEETKEETKSPKEEHVKQREGPKDVSTELSFETTIQFAVGPDATIFRVHAALLKECSDRNLVEDENRIFQLLEVDTAIFSGFMVALYNTRSVPFADWILQPMENGNIRPWYKASTIYILAERFVCSTVQNFVVDTVMFLHHQSRMKCPDLNTVNQIYEELPASSPFRRLVVDICTETILDKANDQYLEVIKHAPRNFLEDCHRHEILRNGFPGRKALFSYITSQTECCHRYHKHPEGISCGPGIGQRATRSATAT